VGVAVDAGGNLHIADTGNCRIRKVAATTGIITTLAGNGTDGYSGGGGPACGEPACAGVRGPARRASVRRASARHRLRAFW
jgi:hypothetical protein